MTKGKVADEAPLTSAFIPSGNNRRRCQFLRPPQTPVCSGFPPTNEATNKPLNVGKGQTQHSPRP